MSLRTLCVSVPIVVLALMTTAAIAHAQEITYLGTVIAVETGRIRVRTVDDKTTAQEMLWFVIDSATRVRRGDVAVTTAAAKITPGERIAVIIDSALKSKMLAKELRLAPTPETKTAAAATGKPASPATDAHAGHQMGGGQAKPGAAMTMTPGWQLAQDGVVYGLFNHQGGPRGGDEFVVPNWWMGMFTRQSGRHQFGVNFMFSLDAATVGKSGYGEIFQVGEALEGKPLVDRQHPHDLFMQLAASWRITLGETSVIVAGGPSGEPTLGPVAFIHRASAAGLILAPLGHHTFDSTHISFGVVTAGVERGRWAFEGSVFNAREPDEHRWDFDLGAMDSVAARIWFRPTEEWEAQVSTGLLREPEELVPGDARRTTTSLSWFRQGDGGFRAVTAGYGVNDAHDERRHGGFGELTIERATHSLFGRVEIQQVETSVLLTGEVPAADHHAEPPATVSALTIGAAKRLGSWRGFEGALGAQVVFYAVPQPLKSTHGEHPVSFQAFFRLRLPSGDMGRMWNMRMSQGHKMAMDHSGR